MGPIKTVSVDLLATKFSESLGHEDSQAPQKFFKVNYQEDVDQMGD